MKVLIIGGNAAGAAAATRLSRENKEAEITILEKGSTFSYSNCGMPYVFSGEVTVDQIATKEPKHLTSKGIKPFANTEAIKIDEDNKVVTAKDTKTNKKITFEYDKLIVATGTRALKLNIKGLDKAKDVYSLKTYDDMVRIEKNLTNKTNALVIGGGFIGVEVAENLAKRGINVTIVEMKWRMAGFDADFSSFLEDKLRKNGIKIFMEAKVDEIKPKAKKYIIDGNEYDFDLIITTGSTPNTEIFKGTSVKVDKHNLVSTDKYMRTSNKDIYAAGDITYSINAITNKPFYLPLARQANSQGRIIADHLSGIKTNGKQKSVAPSGFVAFGSEFAKTGFTEAAAKVLKIKHRIVMATVASNAKYANSGKLVLKMVFASKNNKLLGLQAFGKNAAKAVDTFTTALIAGMDLNDLAELNLIYQPHISTTVNPLNTLANIALNENRLGFTSECPYAVVKEKDVKIIDIRTPEQHKEKGHLKGAINIMTKDLSVYSVGSDLNQNIVVHCNSGFGASIAARKLKELGYKNVRNAYGGNNMYQLMMKKDK